MNNKICKTLLSTFLATTISIVPAATINAQEAVVPTTAVPISMPIDNQEQSVQAPDYVSITGIVQEITEHGSTGERQLVTIEDSEGNITRFVISEETAVLDELKVGLEVTASYDATLPVIMIYPPQYGAKVIASADNEQALNVEAADKKGNERPELNESNKTELLPEDGAAAQRKQWEVNGQLIDAPEDYLNEQGVVMAPLRAIAEALGYEVTWDAASKSVRVGKAISLQVGEDQYIYARMAPIELGTAPTMVDGLTYVPLSFFTDVMRTGEVTIESDRIVIQE